VRVAEAPIAMECTVEQIVEVGDGPTSLVVCRILLWHVDDAILVAGRIDYDRLGAIGRMGTSTYARTADRVTLRARAPPMGALLPGRARRGRPRHEE
jgi:flavin reductase (DIM6/NTAB) family NADH-FMN oxidoreductase RutF